MDTKPHDDHPFSRGLRHAVKGLLAMAKQKPLVDIVRWSRGARAEQVNTAVFAEAA